MQIITGVTSIGEDIELSISIPLDGSEDVSNDLFLPREEQKRLP